MATAPFWGVAAGSSLLGCGRVRARPVVVNLG
ncbi:MAG: hypothetical protein QOI31_1332 [Solirubrobacterales bacterium]|jgi:hypothetical protein|nr:hypothetical protein [Solirubrobacterales bacterium]